MTRYEIRISGYGGQGVITLSKMIITASSLFEGLAGTQTEAYSAAARGGKCWAEVVVDLDKDVKIIDYPKALEPYDFLIILSQEAAGDIKPNMIKKDLNTGFLIWDNSAIQKFRAVKRIDNSIGIPIQKMAVEKFGNIVFSNTILFGTFMTLSSIFSEESALQTIKIFVPSSTLEKNLKAFELGKVEGLKFIKKIQEARI